jgi:S1-C subfamily serine protease
MAAGDLIREVNTRPIQTVKELNAVLQPLATSTRTITFKVWRRGADEVLVVSPPQPPAQP